MITKRTIYGRARAVSPDTKAYQKLLDRAAQANANEGIRQGLDDLAHGHTRPAIDVFNDLRADAGIKSKI